MATINRYDQIIDSYMSKIQTVEDTLSKKIDEEISATNKRIDEVKGNLNDRIIRSNNNTIISFKNILKKYLILSAIIIGILIFAIIVSFQMHFTTISKYNDMKDKYDSIVLKNIELTKQLVSEDKHLNLTDITSPSGLSADQLNGIVNSRLIDVNKTNSKMVNIGETLFTMENEHQINALFCIAVGSLESGYGTSDAAIKHNNLFGMMVNGKIRDFKSIDECILFWGKHLKDNYIGKGLNTIEKIQPKYCPPDSEWDTKIINIMKTYTEYIKI